MSEAPVRKAEGKEWMEGTGPRTQPVKSYQAMGAGGRQAGCEKEAGSTA